MKKITILNMPYKCKFVTIVTTNCFSLTTNLRRKDGDATGIINWKDLYKFPGHLKFNFGRQWSLNTCMLLRQESRKSTGVNSSGLILHCHLLALWLWTS